MRTKEEKQPRSFTRRAFFTLLAAPGIILAADFLSVLVDELNQRFHLLRINGMGIVLLSAPIAEILLIRCIYLIEKALTSGESRWKNIVMLALSCILIVLFLPATMYTLNALLSLPF